MTHSSVLSVASLAYRHDQSCAVLPFLVGQTPYVFDLAKACKHLFILFVNGVSFRHTAKLDHVSMGAMKYEKRIRSVRPAPMLAEVTQLFGIWCRRPYLFI